jgi:hypothetical protein
LCYRFQATRSELQARMSRAEFVELLAAERIEPRGERRDDLRSAQICAVIANAWRGKGSPAVVPADFMPKFGVSERPSRETLRLKLLAFAKLKGATGLPKG